MSDPPNTWPGYYRGYRLRANADGGVWWQVYDGTERLYLDPTPDEIVERLVGLKSLGGRMHVTENQDVLTRVETDSGDYREVWLGEYPLDGEYRPAENPDVSIPVRPENLDPGDLWPSVYDGARFSFVERDRVWWQNPETHRRHYIDTPLPREISLELNRYKSKGGSFRITPWRDLITLIPFHPRPDKVDSQFSKLPEVVRNIIKLRKERGVEMLPIYIGSLDDFEFEIQDSKSLSEPLSEEEANELGSWAENLGRTHDVNPENHQDPTDETSEPTFDDDPEEWDSTNDEDV